MGEGIWRSDMENGRCGPAAFQPKPETGRVGRGVHGVVEPAGAKGVEEGSGRPGEVVGNGRIERDVKVEEAQPGFIEIFVGVESVKPENHAADPVAFLQLGPGAVGSRRRIECFQKSQSRFDQ